jgi:hypothetical protein
MPGGNGNSRGSIAPNGLENDMAIRQVGRRRLMAQPIGMMLRRDKEDGRRAAGSRSQASKRLREHRAPSGKIVELFRVVFPRKGP